MHVDGPGAAEIVIAPDLLQQVRAGEDPARVLREELEQLELLEGEVERTAAEPCRIGGLVDGKLAGADLVGDIGGGREAPPSGGEPEARLQLGGTGCGAGQLR